MTKMKIGPKLIGGFAVVGVIALLTGWMGITNIKTLDTANIVAYEKVTVPLEEIGMASSVFQRQRVNMLRMIRYNEKAQIEGQIKSIDAREKEMFESLASFGKAMMDEKAKESYRSLKEHDEEYEGVRGKIQALALENKDAEAYAMVDGEAYKLVLEMEKDIEELQDNIIANAKKMANDNTTLANKATLVMVILLLAGGLFSTVVGLFLTLSITRPMKLGMEMMNELAKGHLGVRLKMDRGDEIGELTRTMDAYADDLQNNVVGLLKKVALGDVSTFIKAKDEKDEISPAMINVHKALNGLIAEVRTLTKAASEGRLGVRGKAENYKGAYKEIIEGMNNTLDAVVVPVNEAGDVLEKVAEKNMTSRVKGDYKGDMDKLKTSINKAVNNLDLSLQQVSVGAEQVASASGQIGSGSQVLAQGASEQASSLEEISSSLQEMTSMTKQNTANAREAKGLSDAARKGSDKGVANMKTLSAAVDKIKKSSDDTAKIVKTIDEIAFQTNLLALNAAVEAARAGDAGKGFAVVAEEVRNLAMRSAEAAKNTSNMIEESVKNAESGVSLNIEVMKNFEEINTQVSKVSEVMAEIATASEQQFHGIEQLNTAVQQMSQLTQQSAANSEESASAAEELSAQAQEMQTMVGSFVVSGEAGKPRLTHHERAERKPQKMLGPARVHKNPASVIPFGDDKKALDSF